MAHFKKKNRGRYRIQFTMPCELHETYTSFRARGNKLGLVINFSHDFEEWFKNQLEQIKHELNRLEAKQSGSKPTRASDPTTLKPCDLEKLPSDLFAENT